MISKETIEHWTRAKVRAEDCSRETRSAFRSLSLLVNAEKGGYDPVVRVAGGADGEICPVSLTEWEEFCRTRSAASDRFRALLQESKDLLLVRAFLVPRAGVAHLLVFPPGIVANAVAKVFWVLGIREIAFDAEVFADVAAVRGAESLLGPLRRTPFGRARGASLEWETWSDERVPEIVKMLGA